MLPLSLLLRTLRSVCIGVLATAALFSFAKDSQAQPIGGAAVSFPTQDESGNRLALRAMLWLPLEVARGAVVLVHGSGGWSDYIEGHYGRALSAAGYAALAIDTFGPRGIGKISEDQAQITAMQMTRDAFWARRFLLERGFPANHVAVMGFSKGGMAALYAADRNFLPLEVDRFTAALPFYPACNSRPRMPKPASTVFMALGEKDDYTGVKPCQDIADDFAKAGGKIAVKIYPNSSHEFDGNPARTGMINLRFIENYKDCVEYIEEDGNSTYAGKSYKPDDKSIYLDMRKSCARKGASVWTNTEQKEIATRDAINFLNQSFAK